MKNIFGILFVSILFFPKNSSAQIQQGNFLVGGDIASFNLTLGKSGAFQADVDPKVAFFFKNNLALGAYLNYGLSTAKGAGTTNNYGIGILGRYYISKSNGNLLREGRLFFEGNGGIQSEKFPDGENTTGLGIGIGPGYAYFISKNIGLETLLKYNGIVGFGSQAYSNNLNLAIGLQVYLSN